MSPRLGSWLVVFRNSVDRFNTGAAHGSLLLIGFAASVVLLAGCPSEPIAPEPGGNGPAAKVTAAGNDLDAVPESDELLKDIDDALDFTYEKRRLDLKDQAAWQMIHGALAFKRQFLVRDGDKDVSAVDHVLSGGKMTGWNLVKGEVLDEKTGRYGVRAILEQGTKTGQGHEDQWLGYMSGCRIPLDETVVVEGEKHTMEDWLLQSERDVYRNAIQEYSWTLMAMVTYRPTDYKWTAGDGSEWNIENLVEIELGHDLAMSPCGGTHRMVGLTIARNQHVAAGGKLEGVWKQCDDRIKECIAAAKKYQNPDGSLSSNYLQRPGKSADLASAMGSAGHVMEFLAVAMSKDELEQPWVKRAAGKMCELFRKTKPVDVECGALFHAASGLVIYREKVYGPRTFPSSDGTKTTPPEATAATGE